MSVPAPRRRNGPMLPLLGAVLVIAAACLFSLFAFHVSRAPSECGGSSGSCPDGFVPALLGGFGSLFVLAPVGAVLLARALSNAAMLTATLCLGGLAAGCYVAGFVAAPVTDGKLGFGIAAGVFGVLALLLVWPTLRMSDPAANAERIRRGIELTENRENARSVAAATSAVRAYDRSSSAPPTVTHRTTSPTVTHRTTSVRTGNLHDLHELLTHGLATGGLADDGAASTSDPTAARISHLIDLHRRGAIDDDGLREALRALGRRTGADGSAGPR